MTNLWTFLPHIQKARDPRVHHEEMHGGISGCLGSVNHLHQEYLLLPKTSLDRHAWNSTLYQPTFFWGRTYLVVVVMLACHGASVVLMLAPPTTCRLNPELPINLNQCLLFYKQSWDKPLKRDVARSKRQDILLFWMLSLSRLRFCFVKFCLETSVLTALALQVKIGNDDMLVAQAGFANW